MKKFCILLASVVVMPSLALASEPDFQPDLGTDIASLAALGLVSLIVGAQIIKRRKK